MQPNRGLTHGRRSAAPDALCSNRHAGAVTRALPFDFGSSFEPFSVKVRSQSDTVVAAPVGELELAARLAPRSQTDKLLTDTALLRSITLVQALRGLEFVESVGQKLMGSFEMRVRVKRSGV